MMRSPFCSAGSRPGRRSGGDPGHQLLGLGELVDGAEAFLDDLADGDEALADAVLGDVEDGLLRAVEEERGIVLRLVALLHDAGAGVDQVPEDGLLLDDPAPVLDVGDAGDAVEQAGQVGGAAHALEGGGLDQLVLEGDEVDGLALLGEHGHGLEDAAVGLAVEVVAGEDLGRGVEGGVVHEDGAQHRPLRLGVVGKGLFFRYELGGQDRLPRQGA